MVATQRTETNRGGARRARHDEVAVRRRVTRARRHRNTVRRRSLALLRARAIDVAVTLITAAVEPRIRRPRIQLVIDRLETPAQRQTAQNRSAPHLEHPARADARCTSTP